MFKLPQSLRLLPQDNRVPAFGIKVDFAEGALAGHCYLPSNTNALWALIGASASLEERVFFEVEREDAALKFQGYGDRHRFCLFQDTYRHKIRILGSPVIDPENMDLVQIWDRRWELTYFLPRVAFYDFRTLIELGTQSLQSGALGENVVFSQAFPDLGLPDGYC